MDLSYRLDLIILYIIYGSIGEIKKDLGIWSRFKKMVEKNGLVTEVERIKATSGTIF